MKIQSITMLAVLFFLPVLLLSTNYAADFYTGEIPKEDWTLARNKSNIKVYLKNHESNLKAFKAVTTLPVSSKVVVAALMDFDNYPNWMAKCHDSKVLQKITPTEYYYHYFTEAPWPIKNRDNIIHVTIKEDYRTGIVTFDLQNTPDYIPEKPSTVRIQNFEGQWVVTPLKNNKTKIEYSAFADPGGELPTWLVNSSLVNIPYESLTNLKNSL